MNEIPEWLDKKRFADQQYLADPKIVKSEGEDVLLSDVAFNRHEYNDGSHVSPYDNNTVLVGTEGLRVKLVQGIDRVQFQETLSRATKATTGIAVDSPPDERDWEDMMRGGLQSALETQTVVFEVTGASRALTHQLVRSRKAGFHQQSQRATYYGDAPEVRMPQSVYENAEAREAWLRARYHSLKAYTVACEEGISYQDARYILPESVTNYILCEYPLREFINVYAYRACSMFLWEMVTVMRRMKDALVEQSPWLEPYIKISCEKNQKCSFAGWEEVEGQCDLPWAREDNRTFIASPHLRIGRGKK